MKSKFIYKILANLAKIEYDNLHKLTLNTLSSQENLLLKLIKNNQATKFGKLHNFAGINNITDFQNHLPISEYNYFEPYITQMANGQKNILTYAEPFMFASTSGTTGKQKLIPVNKTYINYFRKASIVSGYNLLKAYPKISEGLTLSIFSSANESLTPNGLPIGSISGALMKSEPQIVKKNITAIPYEITSIKNWDAYYYTLLRIALTQPITSIYTLNPSTIMILCQYLTSYGNHLIKDIHDGSLNPGLDINQDLRKKFKFKPDSQKARYFDSLLNNNQFIPKYIWPNLQVVSCWTKASASFYLSSLKQYFLDTPFVDISYGASEGRGSVFCNQHQQLLSINAHFYEFIHEQEIGTKNPKIYLANELEINQQYQILLTTQAGLYRYNIGDVIKVTGFINECPTIEFSHKSNNISSFTGEKITEYQVVEAFKQTSCRHKLEANYFTLIPFYATIPNYILLLEITKSTDNYELQQISKTFDDELAKINIEYEHKRKSLRLGSIQTELLEPGTYNSLRNYLRSHGGFESQIKISNLNPKTDIITFLKNHLVKPSMFLIP